MEDPIREFEDGGYVNLIAKFVGPEAYSYAFDGQWGYLDHALASSTLVSQVTGAAEWHINADEPSVLDYNTDFKPAPQIESLYAPDEFRTSDHDPVIVGLSLDGDPSIDVVGNAGQCLSDNEVTVRVRVRDGGTAADDLEVTATGSGEAIVPGSVQVSGAGTFRTVTIGLVTGKKVSEGLVEVTVDDGTTETTLEIGVLSGTRGADTLTGEAGLSWVLVGGNGADRLVGADLDDLLCGGNGDDVLRGGGGRDTLVGGRGADVLEGGAGADAYDGGRGDDDLVGVDPAVDEVRGQ